MHHLRRLTLVLGTIGLMLNVASSQLPGRDTDIILIIQRDTDNFQESQQFLEEFVSTYEQDASPGVGDTVQFAAIFYDGDVRVAFTLDDYIFNLANDRAVIDAIADMPTEPIPGSDLTGALEKALDILGSQSGPDRIQIVIVLSDGQIDGPRAQYEEVAGRLQSPNRVVLPIEVGEDVNTDNLAMLSSSNQKERRSVALAKRGFSRTSLMETVPEAVLAICGEILVETENTVLEDCPEEGRGYATIRITYILIIRSYQIRCQTCEDVLRVICCKKGRPYLGGASRIEIACRDLPPANGTALVDLILP